MLYISEVGNNWVDVIDTEDSVSTCISMHDLQRTLHLGVKINGASFVGGRLTVKKWTSGLLSDKDIAKALSLGGKPVRVAGVNLIISRLGSTAVVHIPDSVSYYDCSDTSDDGGLIFDALCESDIQNCYKIVITGGHNLTTMGFLCGGLSFITEFDVSRLDTSKAVSMVGMFSDCGCKTLDLHTFNTKSVDDMGFMFEYCKFLNSVNLKGFDVSNVDTVQAMFTGCEALSYLDLSSFLFRKDTVDLDGFLEGCPAKVKTIDHRILHYLRTHNRRF